MQINVGDIVRVKEDCDWWDGFKGREFEVTSKYGWHNEYNICLKPHQWVEEDLRGIFGTASRSVCIKYEDLKDLTKIYKELIPRKIGELKMC